MVAANGGGASTTASIRFVVSHSASPSGPPNPPTRVSPSGSSGSVSRPASDETTWKSGSVDSSVARRRASPVPPSSRTRKVIVARHPRGGPRQSSLAAALHADRVSGALRYGWTTGACATAAAKAAYTALLTGTFPDPVEILLPKGQRPAFALATEELRPGRASAGVVKDAGDDPDVTHGALVGAIVRLGEPG